MILMVLLVVMPLSFHIDILVHEQHDVLIDRQVHGHFIDCIPSCALNCVFDSDLLETIVPILLRDRRTLVIPRDVETLMKSNLSVKNQKNLKD